MNPFRPLVPALSAPGHPQPLAMMGGARPWMAPSVTILPPLALLFLATGDPIEGTGGTGGSGSGVFP